LRWLPKIFFSKRFYRLNRFLQHNQYLNNGIEQDHRFLQRVIKPGLGFKSFNTARRTIKGYEVMQMLRKGQVIGVAKGDVLAQLNFMAQIFGVIA